MAQAPFRSLTIGPAAADAQTRRRFVPPAFRPFGFGFKGGFAAPASLAFRRLPFINRDKRKQKRSYKQ
jgi:hypothetical protein